jgi:uncharacterized protein (TIRG00374 family)
MKKKHTLVTLAVVAVLCLLVYLQVHAWKKFDWGTFWDNTQHVNWWWIAGTVATTYIAYGFRAVRWRIFLKPMRDTTALRLLPAQFIGFTGLALLGRPGEMVRPYLIARKEDVTFTSQVGVWVMERVFDMGAVSLLYLVLAFWGDSFWQTLPNHRVAAEARGSAGLFFLAILGLAGVAFVLRRSGYTIAERLRQRFESRSAGFAHALHSKIVSFTDGLQIVNNAGSFFTLLLISLGMWIVITTGVWLGTHSYGGRLAGLGFASIMMMMVASMFGSMIQLPGVGGGSQLAMIAVLNHLFGVANEIAVSCGTVIWLATFMAPIPVGLLLAHREGLSLRAVAAEEKQAETQIQG